MDSIILRCVIEKEGNNYVGLCLDLDISSFGNTVDEAKKNLREAVELYLEYAIENEMVEELVPRPVPDNIISKYKHMSKRKAEPFTPRYELNFFRNKIQTVGC